jgi:hypothetical protein
MATKFLLLLRAGDAGFAHFSPDDFQQTMQHYFDWTEHLRAEGRLVIADQLKPGGTLVRQSGERIVLDGPYSETKEAYGGFYLITASDLDEATVIAKDCPVYEHGGSVEIRETVPTP